MQTKKIEIFEVKHGFISPIEYADNEEKKDQTADGGELLIIIDDSVWVRHWGEAQETKNRFVRPVYSAEFVRLNPEIFVEQL